MAPALRCGNTLVQEERMSRLLKLVAHGATLKCDKGTITCPLVVTRPEYNVDGMAIANVDDHQPITNINGFGMCTEMANPQVAAATAAAAGTLTPMPCLPVIPSPWSPGAEFIYQEVAGASVRALTDNSKCQCNWGPEISIEDPATDLQVQG
jgi:hypothetical protein